MAPPVSVALLAALDNRRPGPCIRIALPVSSEPLAEMIPLVIFGNSRRLPLAYQAPPSVFLPTANPSIEKPPLFCTDPSSLRGQWQALAARAGDRNQPTLR
ncbi:hypothetical protein LX36DRAFT_300803 [Colletotrichum falcatum]|nr:hypothetical protein LX36DRAFT_300803 [Colletotrichum falcatum]